MSKPQKSKIIITSFITLTSLTLLTSAVYLPYFSEKAKERREEVAPKVYRGEGGGGMWRNMKR